MALYLLKPVVWNSNGYLQPSGARVHSGYPKENGYGHEEWNNSKQLEFTENGKRWKAFHTEGFGNQPLEAHDGRVFVFMIAARSGQQFLVAVAGNATSLINRTQKKQRLSILKKLGIEEQFRQDAWSVPRVRKLFRDDVDRFARHWKDEIHWVPNWICPAESYIALPDPLQLDPRPISGKSSLVRMFGSYQEISRQTALRILDLLPADLPSRQLKRQCTDESDLQEDLADLDTTGFATSTTRAALIEARLGQGRFRDQTLAFWEGKCAITGCSVAEIIRASHLKPWRDSNNKERLDPRNGLPLVAHLDALFDRGLISFGEAGDLLISGLVSDDERRILHLSDGLQKPPHSETARYLKWHRDYVFRAS
ncbi:HNH endonuclease [Mesorhizobium sp. CA15]|uniref:HNH endonuclease n=1 Tax=Mesorhizobium sp. CA15 TaxID=2876641 RepID=UPI001CD080D3|nr:HNH endonuclease [Mesorhizobium sp. CA15]MBZ9867019.1 HNH endonuclease [Mesorhizobium sp. CA15]